MFLSRSVLVRQTHNRCRGRTIVPVPAVQEVLACVADPSRKIRSRPTSQNQNLPTSSCRDREFVPEMQRSGQWDANAGGGIRTMLRSGRRSAID